MIFKTKQNYSYFDEFRPSRGGVGGGMGGGMKDFNTPMNTYGLSTSFLEGLGIKDPLHGKIFVANVSIFVIYPFKNYSWSIFVNFLKFATTIHIRFYFYLFHNFSMFVVFGEELSR